MKDRAVVKGIGFDEAGRFIEPCAFAGSEADEIGNGPGCKCVLQPASEAAHAAIELGINAVGVLRAAKGSSACKHHDQRRDVHHAPKKTLVHLHVTVHASSNKPLSPRPEAAVFGEDNRTTAKCG